MNYICLIGRLTKSPELKKTKNNLAVVEFTLAVPRRGQTKETDFLYCIAWKHTAEFLNKYMIKGQRIAVNGHLRNDSYKDLNGNTQYKTYVLVDSVEFADGKTQKPRAASDNDDGFVPVDDVDDLSLPFN